MLLTQEWTRFAYQRKTLRVTSPSQKQRSAYRLQISYSYNIPLLIAFICLHWLVSQSLFLARVDVYDISDGPDASQSVSTCGYSIIAVILAFILGTVILISAVALGCRRSRPSMPLARGVSAAISAACHPPEGDKHASTAPVKWGAIGDALLIEDKQTVGPVGHCTITSFEVGAPIRSTVYADLRGNSPSSSLTYEVHASVPPEGAPKSILNQPSTWACMHIRHFPRFSL